MTTNGLLRLALPLLIFVGATAGAQSPVNQAVRSAIDSGNAQYIRGFGESNAAVVANTYAPDGGRLSPGGQVAHGTDAIRANVDSLLHQVGPITVTLRTLDLWVMGDRAYETGKWTYTWAKKGGSTTTVGGQYVTAWGRQPTGQWRIAADIGVPTDREG
jgi:uncharacterized protein (TIGR02246 family)